MKKAWPVLPAALLVGGVLYGALAYVNVGDPDIPDPWVEAWEKAGLRAQLRGTRGRIKLTGARDILEKPAYEGTTLREYWVEGGTVDSRTATRLTVCELRRSKDRELTRVANWRRGLFVGRYECAA